MSAKLPVENHYSFWVVFISEVQSVDGYAYWLAIQRYNAEFGAHVTPFVSTDAQAAWWGGRSGGARFLMPYGQLPCGYDRSYAGLCSVCSGQRIPCCAC